MKRKSLVNIVLVLSLVLCVFNFMGCTLTKTYSVTYISDNEEYQKLTINKGEQVPNIVAPTIEGKMFVS